MIAILKMIQIFLLASVKYVFTFPVALMIGLDVYQTIVIVTFGGIAGFFFFYYLSSLINRKLANTTRVFCHYLPKVLCLNYRRLISWRRRITGERVFSRRNRFIARFRAKYGLPGIVILSPVILSIPLGAFLLNKYYSKHKMVKSYMVLSIVSWTAVFILFVLIFPNLVN